MLKLLSANRDPIGDVFLDEAKVLRGVRQEFVEYFTSIINNPDVNAMLGSKIIETQFSDIKLPGYAITLEHPLIAPANYCFEWPMEMYKAAAFLTLDICIDLISAKAVLKDASPWNIFFRGPHPVLVDFASIMPEEDDLIWVGYNQFVCQFLFPLLVGKYAFGRAARSLMLSSQNGISPDEVSRFLPAYANIRYPWLFNRLYVPKAMMNFIRKAGQEKEIARYQKNTRFTSQTRAEFFKKLKTDLCSIHFENFGSQWSKYYDDVNQFFTPDSFHEKQKEISKILQSVKPKTVVDIGCNQGGYSILAANSGAKVIAFDTDEDSVAMLYQLSKEKKLDILPLVSDVLYPSPQCGWRGIEFQPAPKRFRSEMALALALVHHLAITQNQTFERITATLSDYCEKYLVTEFVPIEDPRSQEILLTNRRDISWYTLEGFIEALKKEFRVVQTIPSFPAGRTLCFCEK